jgi:UDP-N-acetylmuramoyl-tripeptide--D-alanyl-D-alanine ligase
MKQHILNTYYKLLGSLARTYIKKTNPYIIGINGSVWKTSCRMIITQTLQQLLPHVPVYTSPKNFNGELGMSLSIFEIETYTPSVLGMISVLWIASKKLLTTKPTAQKVLLLEYWIDHPWEMAFLLSIAKPQISIHTQIDAVHSQQFGDPHAIAKEEFLLQQNTRNIVFLNQEDPYISHVVGTIPCDVITYSATGETEWTLIDVDTNIGNDWEYGIIWQTTQKAKITFNNKKSLSIGINLLGRYHLSYAAVGACIAEIISYAFFKSPAFSDDAHVSLTLALQPGRWSLFDGIYESIIVDSTYNASPRSVKQIIHEASEWRNKKYPTRKLLFVLWDMRELWTQEEKEHIKLAMFLQSYDASLFLVWKVMWQVVEPYFERNWPGRLQQILYFPHYKECADYLQSYLSEHQHEKYIIVCKWSQNTIFLEEVVGSILSNIKDKAKLTRQGAWWEGKKSEFLKSVSK